MSRFTLDPSVRTDLDEIWDYIGIENNSPDRRGVRSRFSLRGSPFLPGNPSSARLDDDLAKGLRAFVVRPFVILYRTKLDGVEIVQVVHSARDIYAVLRHKDAVTVGSTAAQGEVSPQPLGENNHATRPKSSFK